ncbi:hypothetical protein KDA82_14305 [Streptomyces daliensis]|uniref:Uncharacterized protein n=1 Tax=Streptomyces daliensis TaxID=299421 RepID=A0A8T4IQY6_9ACTN|nr:hypothetical protein [Streptomyces daliensis]
MIRNILGSLLALIGATAAVWSPFRPWYDGRLGRDFRVDELFTGSGITGGAATPLSGMLLPMLVGALLTVVAVLLRAKSPAALAGLLVLGFTALWMVRQGQAEGSLTAGGNGGEGLGTGVAGAAAGGVVLLVGALVMRGRRGGRRARRREAAEEADGDYGYGPGYGYEPAPPGSTPPQPWNPGHPPAQGWEPEPGAEPDSPYRAQGGQRDPWPVADPGKQQDFRPTPPTGSVRQPRPDPYGHPGQAWQPGQQGQPGHPGQPGQPDASCQGAPPTGPSHPEPETEVIPLPEREAEPTETTEPRDMRGAATPEDTEPWPPEQPPKDMDETQVLPPTAPESPGSNRTPNHRDPA